MIILIIDVDNIMTLEPEGYSPIDAYSKGISEQVILGLFRERKTKIAIFVFLTKSITDSD